MAGVGSSHYWHRRDLTPGEAKPSALADRFKAPKDEFWLAWHRLRLATASLANTAPPPTFGPSTNPATAAPLLSTTLPKRGDHCRQKENLEEDVRLTFTFSILL